MSSRRNHRDKSVTFTCDECGGDFETTTDDWGDAIAEFKDGGGVVRQEDGEWKHYCDDCK